MCSQCFAEACITHPPPMAQAQRQAGEQEAARLQAQAFEAINDAVRSAGADTLPLVAQLIPLMLSKLGATLQAPPAGTEQRERQSELQARAGGACTTAACAVLSAPSTG